jgi:hypothetical protein
LLATLCAATTPAMAPSKLWQRIKQYGLEGYGSDAAAATDWRNKQVRYSPQPAMRLR